MEHVILFGYIMIFAGGFAGLVSLVAMRLRIKSRALAPLLGVEISFLVALALVAVYFYLRNVLSLVGDGAALDKAFGAASSLVNLLLYAFLLRLGSAYLSPSERRAPAGLVARALCLASIALIALDAALHLVGLAALEPFLGIASYVVIGCAIPAFGVACLRAKALGEHSAVRFLVRGVAWCCLSYAPLSLAEFLLSASGSQPWHPLSLDYLFFVGCTAVTVAAFVRALAVPEGRPKPSLERVTDDCAARFALTAREREMVSLIARGYTNKEIAYELNISPATVRTHIYNLFQKTGVQGRIELINKMSSE